MVAKRLWWVAAVWLFLMLLAFAFYFFQWLSQPNNPLRHEFSIGAAFILLYSTPALLSVALLAIPRFGVLRIQRLWGLALAAVLLALIIIFSLMTEKP